MQEQFVHLKDLFKNSYNPNGFENKFDFLYHKYLIYLICFDFGVKYDLDLFSWASPRKG